MSKIETIRDNDILPYYRNSDYSNGIARGTYKLADLVASVEGVSITSQGDCPPVESSERTKIPWWVYLYVIICSRLSRGSRFGSSGFGGGGGFGGSGCSGSW